MTEEEKNRRQESDEEEKPSLKAFVDAKRDADAQAEDWSAAEDEQEPVRSGDSPAPPPSSQADTLTPETTQPLPREVLPNPEHPAGRKPARLDRDALRRYERPIETREVRFDEHGMPLPPEHEASDEGQSGEGADRAGLAQTRPVQPIRVGGEDTPPHGHERIDPDAFDDESAAAPGQRVTQQHARPRRRKERRQRKERPRRSFWRVLGRVAAWGLGLGLLGGFIAAGVAVFYYIRIINTVDFPSGPDRFEQLQARALQFETTRIYDQSGAVLFEINDPSAGRRDYVTLDQVSPWAIHATVATEDENFFTNPGFSIPAIVRAVYQATQEGEAVSGASTITQQLTRALLLPPEERAERTVRRKIKEIFVAAELSRRFTKEEILELYFNQIYYGNLAYGIEAASQTYFDKPASQLNLAEASFLAGIPQTPALWDPVTNLGDPEDPESPPGVLDRQEAVARLMVEAGGDGCVGPMADGAVICVTRDDFVANAEDFIAIRTREFERPTFNTRYPHWVIYVQQELEAIYDAESIYTSGYDVYTTLDPALQDLAQEQVELQLSAIAPEKNVGSAAVVALDPRTGAILAMIGSRDFDNEDIDGQINMAITPRQPGSSIKPLVYLAAFEQGWTPATVIWDVPIGYEIPGFGVYAPENYDGRFHGPQPVRSALGNSYNTPAVQALDFASIPTFLRTAHNLGIESLGIVNLNRADPAELETVPGIDAVLAQQIVFYRNANGEFGNVAGVLNVPGVDEEKYEEIRGYLRIQEYGLSVALGAGEVSPLEMASAFAAIGNGGVLREPYAIQRIELNGDIVFQQDDSQGIQAVPADDAYLISNILSDNEARTPAFGANSVLATPFTAAAKTGTTNDFRDNWTVGFHPNLAVAVWVGNPDNSQMVDISGVTGAGPIWRGVIEGALDRYPSTEFQPPPTIFSQTVCNDSGTIPSERCLGRTHTEIFSTAHPPPGPEEDVYRELEIDEFTGLIANAFCPDNARKGLFVVVPAHARDWLLNDPAGIGWREARDIEPEEVIEPPEEECGPDTSIPQVAISAPASGEWVEGVVRVRGTADVTNFDSYIVQLGNGADPDVWFVVQGDTRTPVHDEVLAEWNTAGLPDGTYTLRVVVFDTEGNEAQRRVTVNYAAPEESVPDDDEPAPPAEAPSEEEPADDGGGEEADKEPPL